LNTTQSLTDSRRLCLRPLTEAPRISVVVPSFNQGRFLKATLDSILGQSYRPIEIVVMDGGSTDETLDVLRAYGDVPELTWVSERDRGVVDAVNKGFARAQGEILAIQSSDDCYLPGAFARAIEAFLSQPDLALVYGDTVKVDERGEELRRDRIGPWTLENLLLLRTWIPQPSAFFRRECYESLGGWDESIPYAPDTDLWIRIAFHGEVRKLEEYLSQRRIHGAQRDTQAAKIARDYARMIDQSPDIRAASPELRRAAQAGKQLLRVRYNPYGSDWFAAWCLLRAGMIDSRCRNLPGVWRFLTLPLWRLGSRIKRVVRPGETDNARTR
jgi:glycosyltransferase involved in cell wall biosynthesis